MGFIERFGNPQSKIERDENMQRISESSSFEDEIEQNMKWARSMIEDAEFAKLASRVAEMVSGDAKADQFAYEGVIEEDTDIRKADLNPAQLAALVAAKVERAIH